MAGAVREYRWADGKTLSLGRRTQIMGILNVTPDSFSDGGQWNTPEKALAHARQMVAEGADIIDVGAESSRPGFVPMSAEAEMERLRPFLTVLIDALEVPLSVDTFKADTAAMAAEMGVHILNDIWGLQYAPEPGRMAAVAARYHRPVVVMHNQEGKEYAGDIITAMRSFFRRSLDIARTAGVSDADIILDPGIGFGKTPEANLLVLKRLEELQEIDGQQWPLLLGTSRKSFIGAALDLPITERTEATGATCVLGIMKGCGIVRVHEVASTARMCRMIDKILEAQ